MIEIENRQIKAENTELIIFNEFVAEIRMIYYTNIVFVNKFGSYMKFHAKYIFYDLYDWFFFKKIWTNTKIFFKITKFILF